MKEKLKHKESTYILNRTDEEIKKLLDKNDFEEAFRKIKETYEDKLRRSVLKLAHKIHLKRPAEEFAKDAVQQAFAQAFKKINSFRWESGLYTWLYHLATNFAFVEARRYEYKHVPFIDDIESRSRRVKEESKVYQTIASDLPSPEELAMKTEKIDWIKEALSLLAKRGAQGRKDAFMFERYYLQDQSIQDIARELRVSESAAKSRVYYTRLFVKAYIREKMKGRGSSRAAD